MEESHLVREYRAMDEDNFLSSWPREDTEGKATEVEEMRMRTKGGGIKSGTTEFEEEMERFAVDRERA